MSDIHDPNVRALLEAPNHAVISTHNPDGTILSTVVWVDTEVGSVSVNSAEGRQWPANLQRSPEATVVVFDPENPYSYVEIQGTAQATTQDADAQIDRLAQKYLGEEEYPFRQPGEKRVKFVIEPSKVRLVSQ